MKKSPGLLLLCIVWLPALTYAQSPQWSESQSAVWRVIENSWDDDAAENGRWPAAYAGENFVAWGESTPMPRNIDTYTAWERSLEEINDTFWTELTPLAIAIQGDTAVVMYSIYVGEVNGKGERNLNALNLVEVLNRDGRDWKFLATANFTPDYGN